MCSLDHTFIELPDERKVLGIQLGQPVIIKKGNDVSSSAEIRPISRIDDPAIVDITACSDIPSHQFFSVLKEKDQVIIEQSKENKFVYEGFGKMTLQQLIKGDSKEKGEKKVQYLGLLAEGYHISNLFSLIEGIGTNGDQTNVSVFVVNKNAEDSIFIDELTWYAEEKKIQLTVLIEDVPDGVHVLKGQLRSQHLIDFMPSNLTNCHLLVAGSKQFSEKINTMLSEIGYKEDQYTLL